MGMGKIIGKNDLKKDELTEIMKEKLRLIKNGNKRKNKRDLQKTCKR